MSQYSTGARQLRRSRSDRYVGGVCGGVATYLNMDPTLVRILTVVLSLFTGVPVILYLVALFLMPEEDVAPVGPVAPVTPGSDPVWGAGGPPWAPAPGAQAAAPSWVPATPTTAGPYDPPRREGDAS